MSLFRSEVLTHRGDRLSGSVSIAVPVTCQIITYLIFGAISVTLIFLSLASYARVEVAAGAIEPNKGVVAIVPTRNGIVTTFFVRDGQRVSEGALLASVRAEENAVGGSSAAAQIEAAIARQNSNLSAQINAIGASAQAQQQQLAAQRSGLASEITQILSQIGLEQNLVDSAQKDYDRARIVAERGFISGRDLQQREETILARRQQLSQLQQSLASKRADLIQAERNTVQLAAQTNAQTANIAASRAQVDQQAASTQGSRAYVLRAPVQAPLPH